MSDSHRSAAAPPRKRSTRRARLILITLLAVFVLVVGTFGVGPRVLSSYDSSHRETLTCRVDSVEAYSGRSSSRTGIGGEYALVRVRTSSCGILDMREGVTAENAERIAAELTPGRTYDFSVGAGSLRLERLLQVVKQEPPLYDFSPAA
ncbi:hypothetical protein [Frigoribacterium faeni]|uniref:Lipoprotein n=1 Tax=Frigoribacterium faeni TaxID=145483 RepID=A0ABQ0UJX8_9MICO|nr:hypothetical protein [Frigoribacterium faeni]BFF13589.1 hypothetical protein GCM10025699_48920 [Microbacterium flavescens]GEK81786.1 hypothetical protein FFA01_00950 [Frigoribacterium faeni]